VKIVAVIARNASDEAIHSSFVAQWIASLALAMTVSTRATLSAIIIREGG
jgi:hypothetical protein